MYNGQIMRTFRFDKLVRDDIVAEMEREGCEVVWRVLSDAEYAVELMKKLEEELDELDDGAGKNRETDLKELADVAEIYETAWDIIDREENYDLLESAMDELDNGLDMWEIDPDELLEAKAAKINRFGAFKKRIYIEKVSIKEDNPLDQALPRKPRKIP